MRVVLLGLLLTVSLQAGASQRILSLAPFLTDMLIELDATDQLVGVLADPALPAEFEHIPRIGTHGGLGLEPLVARRPDLILAWTSGTPPELLERLERLGITVRRFDPQRLDEIAEVLLELGAITGREARARELAEHYRAELAHIRRPMSDHAPRVFLQVWDDPLYTLSDAQLVGDALSHCGARNVFGGQRILAPQVGRESVLAANPDVILLLADEQAQGRVWLERWRHFSSLRAVRDDRLHVLDSAHLARATPAILKGVRRLCALVEPQH